jgi:hypothetical protein
MNIILDNFNGIAPVIDPRRLADDMAQIAENCYFDSQTLRALRAPKVVPGFTIPSNTKTMFPYSPAEVITFSTVLNIVRSPVHNENFNRLYYSGGAYPMVRSGAASYRLGVPRPTLGPTAAATQVPDDENVDELIEAETLSYVFTYVDGFGAEGPNSVPSPTLERVRNTPVELGFPTLPSGAYNFNSAARIRLYRSNTGTQATDYQFVTDLPIGTANWTDEIPNEELQELLPSADWIGPPDDNTALWPQGPLQGMCAGSDGVLGGFVGRTLHFSVPYLPHAWPLAYRMTSQYDIVAMTPISAGWLVVTTGTPFLVIGSDPLSYTQQPVEGEGMLPCNNARSLVNMGDYAIYSSNAGLVMVEGVRAVLVTAPLLSSREWAAYNPTSMIAGAHMGNYVAFYDTGTKQGSLIFNPMGGKNALTTSDLWTDALYYTYGDSRLYIKDGTTIGEWDAGELLSYIWRSKNFTFTARTGFTYLETIADYTDVEITINADGVTVFEAEITKQYTVLPGYYPALNTWVEMRGTSDVLLVALHELLTPGG